jgi:hypothetical protein
MPPIKKSAKLASGRETEVKRWLPLVKTIKNKMTTTEVYFLEIKFMYELYIIVNKNYLISGLYCTLKKAPNPGVLNP